MSRAIDWSELAPEVKSTVSLLSKVLGWLEDLLGNAIADYEEKHYPVEEVPAAVLVTLMYEHDLTQSDIPEIGSQGVVSEVLSGKRDLNVRQIRDLSERFGVPVACFI